MDYSDLSKNLAQSYVVTIKIFLSDDVYDEMIRASQNPMRSSDNLKMRLT